MTDKIIIENIAITNNTWNQFMISDQIITYKNTPYKGVCKCGKNNIVYVVEPVTNKQYNAIHHWLVYSNNQCIKLDDVIFEDIIQIYNKNPHWFKRNMVLRRNGYIECTLSDDTIIYAPNCDITNMTEILSEINGSLHKACPHLNINFDLAHHIPASVLFSPVQNIPDYFAITLSDNMKKYRASILLTINYDDDNTCTIHIDSKTIPEYEKRGYNKLLRCIAILIAYNLTCMLPSNNKMVKITQLESIAINPISAYTLIHDFDWEVADVKTSEIPKDYKSFSEWFKSTMENTVISHVILTPEYYKFMNLYLQKLVKDIYTKTNGTC